MNTTPRFRHPRCLLITACLTALFAVAMPAQTGPDPFAAGQHWRGRTREDGAQKSIRVVERTAERVVLEVEGFAAGAVFRIAGATNGRRATIDDVQRTKHAKGSRSVKMVDVRGTAVLFDGKLTLHVAAKMRGRGIRSWALTCADAEPLPPPSPPGAELLVGRSWRGKTTEDGGIKTIRVVARRGATVAFEAEGFAAGALFRFEGTLRGRVVAIDNVRRTRHPKGSNAVAMHDPHGWICLRPGGELQVTVRARMHGSGRRRSWSFVCPRAVPQ